MKYLYLSVIIVLLGACASIENTKSPVTQEIAVEVVQEVSDLTTVSQDINTYTQNLHFTSLGSQDEYEKKYFRVWNIDTISISSKDAQWAHRSYIYGKSYGVNLQLLDKSFFQEMLTKANFEAYASINKNAVSLKTLSLRAFPTQEALLLDPSRAGEGFPFDYLQNSLISANKPLIISHYSRDGEWAFVESSFAFGWVKRRDISLLDKKYTDLWQEAEQIFITKDGVPIYGENDFLFNSRLGMMFALISEDEESYTVLSISNYKNSKPLYLKSKLSKSIAHKGILEFNAQNINSIFASLSDVVYGWGGMYEQRDCSSTLRDFYAPFGLWLPRNSYKQSLSGELISLEGLSDKEKLNKISLATPFRTLVYKKGHIALYVGSIETKVIIYQNVWGVKTLKDGVEGRFIVGKPVFSTLEIGKNLKEYDATSSMLKKAKSITKL